MKTDRLKRMAITLTLCALTSAARGQSMARLTIEPWNGTDLNTSYDHPLVEFGGHANGTQYVTSLSWWDSYGRVRFDRNDPDSPFVAYRIFTMDAGTHDPQIHSTIDDLDLAVGFHVAHVSDWDVTALLGAGYSGTHPFVGTGGIFGIGDLNAVHNIDDQNSILLAVDYAGNNALLPDVPLPGFAMLHHETKYDYMLGFPVNRFRWRPIQSIEFTANYTAPYTGSLNLEYRQWRHVGFYANASNFFQGAVIRDQTISDRELFQMRRVEAGVRFIFDPWVDAAIGIGYAFDQTYSEGFDIRNMRGITHLSNEPYIALVVRGSF
jgi:hypothetical protein